MTPLELACRVCDAQAGEPCTYVEDGQVTAIQVLTGYHAERFEDAAMMTRKGDAVTKSELDAAIAERL